MPKENPILREVILEREKQAKGKGPRKDFSTLEGILLQAIKKGFDDDVLAFALAQFIWAAERASDREAPGSVTNGDFMYNDKIFVLDVSVKQI